MNRQRSVKPHATVVIEGYDPTWPVEFERLKTRVLKALGDDAVGVEHVGSTAVPGLAAKPVIDLDVVVRSTDDLPDAIERLAAIGYVHRGDLGIPGREAFQWLAGERRHHLYVVVAGNREHRRHLMFRDYLRAHREEAVKYARLKRELAREHAEDRDAYTGGKSEFVERVLAAAEKEYNFP